jgi:hypothetical protein
VLDAAVAPQDAAQQREIAAGDRGGGTAEDEATAGGVVGDGVLACARTSAISGSARGCRNALVGIGASAA